MNSYIPNNRYKWRKSLIALIAEMWTPLSWFLFMVSTGTVIFMLMSMGALVWIFASLFTIPFMALLIKRAYDWMVDSYEVVGSWLVATQRTSLQTLSVDRAPLMSVRNVEVKLEGILGETFGLVGDVIVQVEGLGVVTFYQVGAPQHVARIVEEASNYWVERSK